MNKMKLVGVDTVILQQEKSNGKRVEFQKTLEYFADSIIESYYTPDDRLFEFKIDGQIKNSGITLLCNFTPLIVKKKMSRGRFATLAINLHYKSDIEMIDHFKLDIIIILARFGLAALYNTTGEQILVDNYHPKNDDALKYALS